MTADELPLTGQEFLTELNRRINAYIADHESREYGTGPEQARHRDGLINGVVDAYTIAEQIITSRVERGVTDQAMAKYI